MPRRSLGSVNLGCSCSCSVSITLMEALTIAPRLTDAKESGHGVQAWIGMHMDHLRGHGVQAWIGMHMEDHCAGLTETA
jgi:hypothetical protein